MKTQYKFYGIKFLWEGNAGQNKSRMNVAAAGGICVSQTHLVFIKAIPARK